MTTLLDLTGPVIPGLFTTPARMLTGPWRVTWSPDWNSATGNGKEWTPLFVFSQAGELVDALELQYVAGVVTLHVSEPSSGRLAQVIAFSSTDTITIVVNPVLKRLTISGAASGNGAYSSGGGTWWPGAGANVRVGDYDAAYFWGGPLGGVFSDVVGFNAPLTGALTGTAAPILRKVGAASFTGGLSGTSQARTNQLGGQFSGGLAGTATAVRRVHAGAASFGALTGSATPSVLGAPSSLFLAFLSQLQALLPPGKAWTRNPAAVLTRALRGFVPELVRVQERIDTLLRELNPGDAVELLSEYETAYGLPDACTTLQTGIAERQADLLARLREDAGHNPADYIALAATAGYAGALVYRRPFPPFAVGESGAGERLYGEGGPSVYILAYMANRVASPNDFTTWNPTGTSSVNANAGNAPDGTATADRLNIGSPIFSYGLSSPSAPNRIQFSVWLRSESGEKPITLWCAAGAVLVAQFSFIADTKWRRFVYRAESALPITHAHIASGTGAPLSVLAWSACIGVFDERFECRMSHVQQAHTEADFRVFGDYPAD